MKTQDFKTELENKAQELKDFINEVMPDNGLKCEQSQKVCLLNALNSFEHAINGIEDEDLNPEMLNKKYQLN